MKAFSRRISMDFVMAHRILQSRLEVNVEVDAGFAVDVRRSMLEKDG